MKTIGHNLILLLLIVPYLAFAGNDLRKGRYTKEKKIAKAYIVNPDCGLQVDNQFGSIYVTTWDENKTQIEVVITVSGNNENKVNKRLSGISVDFNATTALVKASTSIDDMNNNNNLNMEINYTIKIPKKGSINLENQYGDIITGKINGKANIECQYGDVTIDELNADNNSLNFQYSYTVKINYIKNADINAQYSDVQLTKAGNLKLNIEYSPVKIDEVKNLIYNAEYRDLNIGNADNVSGSSDYTAVKFGYVSGNFNATSNYGEVKIGSMSKNAKNVTINVSYCNVNLNYNENVPFDFEFNLEYGRLNGASGLKFTEKSDRDNQARYKGYYKSSGINRIYIKSEYGDINLGK